MYFKEKYAYVTVLVNGLTINSIRVSIWTRYAHADIFVIKGTSQLMRSEWKGK